MLKDKWNEFKPCLLKKYPTLDEELLEFLACIFYTGAIGALAEIQPFTVSRVLELAIEGAKHLETLDP